MRLSEIAAALGIACVGGDTEITSVDYDSRAVQAGSLFCCVRGLKSDGHDFAAQAAAQGARALLCEHPLPVALPQLVVPDARKGMAEAAACFYRHPERELHLLGVTGTNGKTSTTYMVKAIAEEAGLKVGLIGTIHNLIGDEVCATGRTTPESVDLFALLRRMADAGCRLVVMEVSSHALAQDRVHGLQFDAALFTNLTQDHLDYHKTFENYLAAKKRLFYQTGIAIVNADDPAASKIAEGLPCPVHTIGITEVGEYRASAIDVTTAGVRFHLHTPYGDCPIALHISGLFSVYNAMGAAALCLSVGLELKEVKAGLEKLKGVAGRLQRVDSKGKPFSVYVDYAHTPDALDNVLRTAREFAKGRVISVFGCGGDRDRAKRPQMGEIGGRLSDFVVVTSDNPRTEEPESIVRAVEEGVKRTGTPYVAIVDRQEGIRYALEHAKAEDVIVVAGKGHEDYQEINGVKHHFDDREIVEAILEGKR